MQAYRYIYRLFIKLLSSIHSNQMKNFPNILNQTVSLFLFRLSLITRDVQQPSTSICRIRTLFCFSVLNDDLHSFWDSNIHDVNIEPPNTAAFQSVYNRYAAWSPTRLFVERESFDPHDGIKPFLNILQICYAMLWEESTHLRKVKEGKVGLKGNLIFLKLYIMLLWNFRTLIASWWGIRNQTSI